MQIISSSLPKIQTAVLLFVTFSFSALFYDRSLGFDGYRISIVIFLSLLFVKKCQYPKAPKEIHIVYISIIAFLIYLIVNTLISPYAVGLDLIGFDNWLLFLPVFYLVSLTNITKKRIVLYSSIRAVRLINSYFSRYVYRP